MSELVVGELVLEVRTAILVAGVARQARVAGAADLVDDLKTAMDEIPEKVVSELKADTKKALQDIANLKRQIDLLKGKTITITTRMGGTVRASGVNSTTAWGGGFTERAEGGYISGPGTKTSDSIPAYLSNGEYVIKASAVDKYGKHFFDRLNAMRFADGGHVVRGASPAAPMFDASQLAGMLQGSGLTVNVTGGDPHRAALAMALRQRGVDDDHASDLAEAAAASAKGGQAVSLGETTLTSCGHWMAKRGSS